MKKFLQFVTAVKTTASFAFTGGVMLVTVAFMLFGKDSIPTSYIWQMIFLALICGCLHLVAFSDNVFRRVRTIGRTAFLGVAMLAVLTGFALAFHWFPVRSAVNWLAFTGVYAAAFLIAVFALRTVFRLGGMKYGELLAAYKARRES